MSLADLMSKIDGASMTQGGIWLLTGDYKLKIREVKNGRADSQGWDFFLTEVEVVESTNPDRPAGMVCEWMVPFKNPQYEKTYLGNVKNFLWAAFNGFDPTVTPEQITAKVWALAVSEAQPLRDRYVAATAVDKKKKYAKDDDDLFTRITFQPWSGPGAQVAA